MTEKWDKEKTERRFKMILKAQTLKIAQMNMRREK